MITIFTPSFADESNTNAQNLTVKEVVARLDPSCFRVMMLADGPVDPRIANRENTEIFRWRKHGNTAVILVQLLGRLPDVYFFPREGPLDSAFLGFRGRSPCALVTYVVSGGLEEACPDDRPILRRAIRDADIVAGNSRRMSETVRKLGGKDVRTVYDGIDRRYYYSDRKSQVCTEEKTAARDNRVLFAGSLRPYKRVDLLVRQASRFPQWQFRIAGTGEEEDACRNLAHDLGCRNVHFLGHLNAAQLGEEMRQAQLFFFPSEMEGHPQVLGQAAACGLPCIARSSYEPDYVINGETGLLANNDDQLGQALESLIENPELRNRMSGAAIRHAEKFDWDSITKQWAAIMEEAIAKRKIRNRSS